MTHAVVIACSQQRMKRRIKSTRNGTSNVASRDEGDRRKEILFCILSSLNLPLDPQCSSLIFLAAKNKIGDLVIS